MKDKIIVIGAAVAGAEACAETVKALQQAAQDISNAEVLVCDVNERDLARRIKAVREDSVQPVQKMNVGDYLKCVAEMTQAPPKQLKRDKAKRQQDKYRARNHKR